MWTPIKCGESRRLIVLCLFLVVSFSTFFVWVWSRCVANHTIYAVLSCVMMGDCSTHDGACRVKRVSSPKSWNKSMMRQLLRRCRAIKSISNQCVGDVRALWNHTSLFQYRSELLGVMWCLGSGTERAIDIHNCLPPSYPSSLSYLSPKT